MARINISQILMKRGNTTAANTYVGPLGELVVDTGLRTVRVQDGVTPGGMSTLATDVQLQALGTYANATFGTSSYGNANVALHLLTSSIIGNINANITAANAAITSLTSNAATQATLIDAINANVTAANAAIISLTSNAAIQASILDTLTGNAASQSTLLDTLTSNAAIQSISLTTLLSNAVTQQTSLTDLVANAAAQAQAIANAAGTYGNANVEAYIGANIGTLYSNAATQATSINAVTANIGSFYTYANLNYGTSSYANANVAAYLPTYTGNIAGNIVKSGYTWTFSNTGTTTFPTGVRLSNARGANTVNFTTDIDKSFQIETQTSATSKLWNFTTDGNLTLPQNANINFSNGVSILSTVTDLYANAAVQSANIATLFSNAATQAGSIATLQTQVYANANVNTYLSSSVIGSLSTSGNLTVGGNLIVNGNTTVINTASYTVDDNIIQMADGNPADSLDLGFVAHRTVGATLQHTGLIRDASAGNWRLFSNVTTQPGATVDFTSAVYDDLVVGNISANIVKNGYTWTFGTDGALTLPASSGQIGRSGYPDGIDLYNNNGGTGYVRMNYADQSAVWADSGGAHVQTSGANTWDFGTDANLTLPETGYLRVGTGIVAGFASSPAPFISGFSSVSAENFKFQGNGVNILSDLYANAAVQSANIATINNTLTSTNVAIGYGAGQTSQGGTTVAVGSFAGMDAQGLSAVAVGFNAGQTTQGIKSVAIGMTAGYSAQGNGAVAIGDSAGYTNQGVQAIAIGKYAGLTSQSTLTVAVGHQAGETSQGLQATAVGSGAGNYNQSAGTVAIGTNAGAAYQGLRAVAVGSLAGSLNQGEYAVALGNFAGGTDQGNNSIIINATGSSLDQTTANTFTVAPVRNDVANVAQVMFYNTTSKEITYGNTISVAGNINASQFNFANGVNILSTVAAGTYGNTEVAAYIPINPTITALQANIGSFYTYANATYSTGGGGTTYTDANVVSLLAANSSIFVGNTNNVNTYSLQSNITQVFIGGNTTIASGNANVTNSTSLLHNMYFAANGTRLVRNTGAGVGTLSFDPTGFTVSGLVTVQTANSAPALPHWIKANVNGLFAPSGFTTSTITASGTVAVNATTGIQTNQTTFPLVNQTATTILFGGAATSISLGSATIGGSGSNVFVGNAIGTSSGNLTVRAFGTYNSVNSLNSNGGYGTTTYSNIAVTGGSGTGMIISMSGAASGYLASATVTNPGTGYRNGETITIPAGNPVGSLGGSFVIGNYNAAYLGQVLADYSFGIDGNLRLPGNVTIASVGSIRYANGVNYASTVTGTYSNTNVASYLTTATITTTGNITAGNLTATGTFTVADITTTGAYGNITGANVISANTVSATNYLFANGVNILSTVGAGSYGNTEVAAYLPTYSGNVGAGNIVTTGATSGNISGANYISANAFQVSTGIFWANGTAWSSSGGGTTYSNANVASYLTAGNISVGTAGYTVLPNIVAQFTTNVNSYGQVNMQNINAGTDATTEIVATANNGTDTIFFIDMGIAGNTYDNSSPSNSLGTIIYANDAYLYAQGNTSANVGGNLAIGTSTAGRSVTIFAGGINRSSNVATFANTGVTVYGNITAANIITTGTYGNITNANVISANNLVVTTTVRTIPVTFAALPTAASAGAGARAFITDGNVATFGSQVGGSGANAIPVYSNGTNWYVG